MRGEIISAKLQEIGRVFFEKKLDNEKVTYLANYA